MKTPRARAKYGRKAEEYIRLAEQVFEKWDQRGCWREVKEGGLWVVPPFGIDRQTGKWTEGYARRNTDGFSLPANKQNFIALWLLAMYEATQKARLPPAGGAVVAADEVADAAARRRANTSSGTTGTRPGRGTTSPTVRRSTGSACTPTAATTRIDVEGIVTAYEHGLVFGKEDLERLIATNRDFMWNQQIQGAKFQRIDGGKPDRALAKIRPGVLWTALVPHDETLRKVFEANHQPDELGRPGHNALVFRPAATADVCRDAGRPLVASLPCDDNGKVRF